MTTRVGHAADFQAVVPMMWLHRQRQQQQDPALYALHPEAERRFRLWMGRMAEDARATLIVADEDGQLAGFLYATIEKDLPIFLHDEFALIREWWVEPSFRERGVGKALLKHAAAELAKVGIHQVRVRTSAADHNVRATIQRCGFRPGPSDMVMDLRPRS